MKSFHMYGWWFKRVKFLKWNDLYRNVLTTRESEMASGKKFRMRSTRRRKVISPYQIKIELIFLGIYNPGTTGDGHISPNRIPHTRRILISMRSITTLMRDLGLLARIRTNNKNSQWRHNTKRHNDIHNYCVLWNIAGYPERRYIYHSSENWHAFDGTNFSRKNYTGYWVSLRLPQISLLNLKKILRRRWMI